MQCILTQMERVNKVGKNGAARMKEGNKFTRKQEG